jgi:guanylate kinase
VNKNFDRAYADLGHIYRAERMKPGRNPWLPGFVDGLLADDAGEPKVKAPAMLRGRLIQK